MTHYSDNVVLSLNNGWMKLRAPDPENTDEFKPLVPSLTSQGSGQKLG